MSKRIVPSITSRPVSERITRHRTYTIIQTRSDFHDALAQFAVLLKQLHDDAFSGSLTLHFGQGTVNHVEAIESQKVPT